MARERLKRPVRRCASVVLHTLPPRAQEIVARVREPQGLIDNHIDDEALRSVIRVTLARGGAMLDVGANIGNILAAAYDASPDGAHVAVEPLPECAAVLRERFPTLEIQEVAAGHPRVTEFYEYQDRARSSLSDLPGMEVSAVHHVDVRPIDEIVDSDHDIKIFKIDVECHELEVLESAPALLARRPLVALEHGAPSTDSAAIYELLQSFDYRIQPTRGAPLSSAQEFVDLVASGKVWNFVAVTVSPA